MQVELSIRENDVFIGTVLKVLEIEDLVGLKGTSQITFLARSFFRNADGSLLDNTDTSTPADKDLDQFEGDDEFYEASENLNDFVGSPVTPGHEIEYMGSQMITQSNSRELKALSFVRVNGLLPVDVTHLEAGQIGVNTALDSFVKAQIVILDQSSSLYSDVDKQVWWYSLFGSLILIHASYYLSGDVT